MPGDRPIDREALGGMSVVPGEKPAASDARQHAGQDRSIAKRLEKDPESADARLDNALDESMDASDPPSSTQPVHRNDPAPSSGYDPAAEKKRGARD